MTFLTFYVRVELFPQRISDGRAQHDLEPLHQEPASRNRVFVTSSRKGTRNKLF